MLVRLLPRIADNRYPGQRLGLWLFALMLIKIAMGLNVMVNARAVAETADGIPVQSFGPAAGSAFLFMFAAWGLCPLVLGLASLIVLVRYRSLVPLTFLVLLVEQVSRLLLKLYWPVERVGTSAGTYINVTLVGIMALGLILSLWQPRTATGVA